MRHGSVLASTVAHLNVERNAARHFGPELLFRHTGLELAIVGTAGHPAASADDVTLAPAIPLRGLRSARGLDEGETVTRERPLVAVLHHQGPTSATERRRAGGSMPVGEEAYRCGVCLRTANHGFCFDNSGSKSDAADASDGAGIEGGDNRGKSSFGEEHRTGSIYAADLPVSCATQHLISPSGGSKLSSLKALCQARESQKPEGGPRLYPLLAATLYARCLADAAATGNLAASLDAVKLLSFAEIAETTGDGHGGAEDDPDERLFQDRCFEKFTQDVVGASVANRRFFDRPTFWNRALGALRFNCFAWSEGAAGINASNTTSGLALYKLSSFFNHACDPSCQVSFHGSTLEVRAGRSIAPGEELTISYLDEEGAGRPRDERRAVLQAKYGFVCQCARCLGNK